MYTAVNSDFLQSYERSKQAHGKQRGKSYTDFSYAAPTVGLSSCEPR